MRRHESCVRWRKRWHLWPLETRHAALLVMRNGFFAAADRGGGEVDRPPHLHKIPNRTPMQNTQSQIELIHSSLPPGTQTPKKKMECSVW